MQYLIRDTLIFKGLIEPAFDRFFAIYGLRANAGFMTQQGQALRIIS